MKCIFCGKEIKHGNNPQPVAEKGACCDECNANIVIPARLNLPGRTGLTENGFKNLLSQAYFICGNLARCRDSEYLIETADGWVKLTKEDRFDLSLIDELHQQIIKENDDVCWMYCPLELWSNGKKYEIEFNDTTAYNEPQAWIYLADGTSLEITYESYGLAPEDRYFSVRHHCSDDAFDNGEYHSTMGVMEQVCGSLTSVHGMIERICHDHKIAEEPEKGPKIITISSKDLAVLEDEFEDNLFDASLALLRGCLYVAKEPTNITTEDIANTSYDNDIHNEVKQKMYEVFKLLGYDICSDGLPF